MFAPSIYIFLFNKTFSFWCRESFFNKSTSSGHFWVREWPSETISNLQKLDTYFEIHSQTAVVDNVQASVQAHINYQNFRTFLISEISVCKIKSVPILSKPYCFAFYTVFIKLVASLSAFCTAFCYMIFLRLSLTTVLLFFTCICGKRNPIWWVKINKGLWV